MMFSYIFKYKKYLGMLYNIIWVYYCNVSVEEFEEHS